MERDCSGSRMMDVAAERATPLRARRVQSRRTARGSEDAPLRDDAYIDCGWMVARPKSSPANPRLASGSAGLAPAFGEFRTRDGDVTPP